MSKKVGIGSLARELSDEDDNSDTTPMPSDNSDAPWHAEFRRYIDARHELPVGTTPIQWWGVSLLFIARIPYTNLFRSIIRSAIPFGRPSLAIISLSWHRLFQASGCSRNGQSRT
jgi:hypothetical protein